MGTVEEMEIGARGDIRKPETRTQWHTTCGDWHDSCMNKTKIFVVEDERIVSLALQRALNKLGYAVAGAAASGEAALESIPAAAPDLVLMDIQLEGELDGVATAERIHSMHDLPVIYLTGYSDGETLQRAKITEPSAYILKPFEERELHIAIDTALYRHSTEARLRQFQKMESVGRSSGRIGT